MRTFNLQLAKGALEEKLADTGMALDDLEPTAVQRQLNELLRRQADARWKARHAELQELREGLYADLYAEAEAAAAKVKGGGGGKQSKGMGRALKSMFAKPKRRASVDGKRH